MSRAPASRRRIPRVLSPRVVGWLGRGVVALAMVPLAVLVIRGFSEALGANPVEAIERSLGTWTLVWLLGTLAITPLRRLTGWIWLLPLRRRLGLLAFLYALLHVSAFVWLDHWFDWAAIGADVIKRPYLNFGLAAFVLMIPLAATSTNAMARRLGGRNWQRLHWLIYPIGVLGVLHYWFHKLAKNDLTQPKIYAAVLGLLLGARLVAWLAARWGQGSVDSPANRSAVRSR
jgi:sulfoxide reductase heme-binding subunit YedZ